MIYKLTNVKKIKHPKGDVYHALKKSEPEFSTFGEAYFTTIKYNETKGWKRHKKMRLNLTVPVGNVKFSIYDDTQKKLDQLIIGEDNYKRLTIEPGAWVAFHGLSPGVNLILNIASCEHDPDEAENFELDHFQVNI